MPKASLLGELFANIARVPAFVLSERVERGVCLTHSLRVLLIWHVSGSITSGGRMPPNLLRSNAVLQGTAFPPPLETEDTSTKRGRFAECSWEPHKHSEADVAHP